MEHAILPHLNRPRPPKLDTECPVPRNPKEACQDQKSNSARDPICAGRARNRFLPKFHGAGLVRGVASCAREGRETGFRSGRHLVRRQHGSPLLDEIYRSVGRRRRSRGGDDELHICERRAAARVQRGPRITDFGEKTRGRKCNTPTTSNLRIPRPHTKGSHT